MHMKWMSTISPMMSVLFSFQAELATTQEKWSKYSLKASILNYRGYSKIKCLYKLIVLGR